MDNESANLTHKYTNSPNLGYLATGLRAFA